MISAFNCVACRASVARISRASNQYADHIDLLRFGRLFRRVNELLAPATRIEFGLVVFNNKFYGELCAAAVVIWGGRCKVLWGGDSRRWLLLAGYFPL